MSWGRSVRVARTESDAQGHCTEKLISAFLAKTGTKELNK